jgi:hypothetical protein
MIFIGNEKFLENTIPMVFSERGPEERFSPPRSIKSRSRQPS